MFAAIRRKSNKLITERLSRSLAWRQVRNPVVSVTFDDFPKSALTVGGNILIENGCAGTYYAAMGLMGATTAIGAMFERADLDDLLSQGHEVGCHTLDHVSCLSVPSADFIRGCAANREKASALLTGQELQNFSFPFGDVTLAAKRLLRSAYATCRSIEPGINLDPVDLSFLRANRMYSVLPSEPLERLILANARCDGWLVLYTHDVSANPSPYGCTPKYLEHILRCALDSGAEVLTVREAASRFRLASSGEPNISSPRLAVNASTDNRTSLNR